MKCENVDIPSDYTTATEAHSTPATFLAMQSANNGIRQSINCTGGRCHDNARYHTEKMITDECKVLIWRYLISYKNNRRICSANGGLPPMV